MRGQIYRSFGYILGINGVGIQRKGYRGCLFISSGSAFPRPTVIPVTVKVYNDLLQRLLNGNGLRSNFFAARDLSRSDLSRIGYAIGYICLLGRVAVGDDDLIVHRHCADGVTITLKGNRLCTAVHGDLGAIRPLGIRNHHIVQSNVAVILHCNGVLDRIANGHARSGVSRLSDAHTGISRGQSVRVSNTFTSRRYRSTLYGFGTIPGASLDVLSIRSNTVHIRNICQHRGRLNRLPALSCLIKLLIVVDLSHSRLTGRPGTTNNGIVHSRLVLIGNLILIRIHRVDCGNGDRSGYRAAQPIGAFRQPVIHILRAVAASDRHRQLRSTYCVRIRVVFILSFVVRSFERIAILILIVDGDGGSLRSDGNGICSNFFAARDLSRSDLSRIGYAIGYICLLGRVAVGDDDLIVHRHCADGVTITLKGNRLCTAVHGDLGAIRPLGIRNHHIVQSNVAVILHCNGVLDRIANGHARSGVSRLSDAHTGISRGQSVRVSNTFTSRRYRSTLYGFGTIPGASLDVLSIRSNTVHIRNICQHRGRLNRLPALSCLIKLLIVVDLSHSRLTGRPGTTNNGIVHSRLVLIGNLILIRIHRVDCGNGDRSGYRAAQFSGAFRQPVIHILRTVALDNLGQRLTAYCVQIRVVFILSFVVRSLERIAILIHIVNGDVVGVHGGVTIELDDVVICSIYLVSLFTGGILGPCRYEDTIGTP